MKILLLRRTFLTLSLSLLGACAIYAGTLNQLTPQERADGWRLLFDGHSTAGWHSFKQTWFPAKGWVVEDGWLQCQGSGGGDVLSDAEFEEFDLRWEWKIEAAGNS